MNRKLSVLILVTSLCLSTGGGVVAAQANEDTYQYVFPSGVKIVESEWDGPTWTAVVEGGNTDESLTVTDAGRVFENNEPVNIKREPYDIPSGERVRIQFTVEEASRVTVDDGTINGLVGFGEGGSDLELLPDVEHPILTTLGGGLFALALILGLDLLANRKSKKAFNPLK